MAGFVVLAVLVLLGWRVFGTDEYVAPTPQHSHAVAEPTAAQSALRDLASRIRSGRMAGAGRAVEDVVKNARALHVRGFSATYVDEAGAVAADGTWPGAVRIRWRFAGFDRRDAASEVSVTFARNADGDGVHVASFGGTRDRLPVWLSGPVQVRRGPGELVLARGSAREADSYLRIARRAVATVRRVVPWQRPNLVFEVPEDQAGMEAALAAQPGSYAEVAAVTATVDGSMSPSAPVHVFVNPALIGKLSGRGAQVVLSHEATHDATRVATNTRMPEWLLEGFADYVALRDVDLPLSKTAGQILPAVRKHGAPDHLPGPAEFNQHSEDFGSEYEAAWLACRLFAQSEGQRQLVELYDKVRAGEPVDRAMRQVVGFGVADFTRRWQGYLTHLAS